MANPILKLFAGLNANVYRMSGGRIMGKMGASEICVVRMRGANSGKWRDVPLMHVPNGNGVILVASLGGAPKHPVWYYNLVAHPDIEVQVKQSTLKLRARLASPEEKAAVVAALRRRLSAVRGVSEADHARHPGLHLRPEVRSRRAEDQPGAARRRMLSLSIALLMAGYAVAADEPKGAVARTATGASRVAGRRCRDDPWSEHHRPARSGPTRVAVRLWVHTAEAGGGADALDGQPHRATTSSAWSSPNRSRNRGSSASSSKTRAT